MRRKDREITDKAELESLLRQGRVCHLAMCGQSGQVSSDEAQPYVLPVNYGYADGALYVHGASKGRKADILRTNPRVAFSIVLSEELKAAGDGCEWTTYYVSLCGEGRAEVIEKGEDKALALTKFMEHYAPGPHELPAAAVAGTMVVRIAIESLSGKRNPGGR